MAFTGQLQNQIKVVVKNTFLELEHGHKATQDFREYVGFFKSRARSDSPRRDRLHSEDLDVLKEKFDLAMSDALDAETASGESSPSEVSSGNDLMSQESFEQDFSPQQEADLKVKRTPLRTPLKSQSSPFVPMFQWSCMVGPFLQGCETDGTQYHGIAGEPVDFEQQVVMQPRVNRSRARQPHELDDTSPSGWSPGYGSQSWFQSNASSKKLQKKANAMECPLSENEEDYTTVMFRNLPNDYSQQMLLALLDSEGFEGLYDFLYVPFDFKRRAGLGYAFINMVSPDAARKIKSELQGFKKWSIPSKKVLEVCYSKPLQGLAANIERYRNSPVMHPDVPEEFKPALFENKRRIPFPAPTVSLRPPAA
jgi:hypothetical protein|mmetsp:Transcript_54012/g.85965  ORF Transcript_54012/g.85965 Transcript_54012/m.85965 type:complete len:366 (+) Transcript_54012:168-1265(+)